MSQSFALTPTPHRAFGRLLTLSVASHPSQRLTAQEAAIVARALKAVATRKSEERQIYMSPIASDLAFCANVEADGVRLQAPGAADVALDWAETLELARALAEFGGCDAAEH